MKPFGLLTVLAWGVFWLCSGTRTLNSKEEFLAWHNEAKQGNFGEEDIELGADIDLDGESILPLGLNDEASCTPFQGVFDGRNFSIGGLVITNTAGDAALFCYLNGATVKNLVVASSCHFNGKCRGRGRNGVQCDTG